MRNKALKVRTVWGKKLTIVGNAHGIVVADRSKLYILWVSGAKCSMNANYAKVFDSDNGTSDLSITFSEDSMTTTIISTIDRSLLFIGSID